MRFHRSIVEVRFDDENQDQLTVARSRAAVNTRQDTITRGVPGRMARQGPWHLAKVLARYRMTETPRSRGTNGGLSRS